jgi:hypothetical protein
MLLDFGLYHNREVGLQSKGNTIALVITKRKLIVPMPHHLIKMDGHITLVSFVA